MVKRISPAYRSVTGTVRLPRTKQTAGMNLSYWLRIGEVCIESHRGARPDPSHFQVLDVKFKRQFVGPPCIDDKLCLIADELIYNYFNLATLRCHLTHLAASFSGWQVQLQSLHEYRVDVNGRAKKI